MPQKKNLSTPTRPIVRSSLSAGSEKRAQRHTELAGAANQVRAKLRQFANQRQTFLALQDEVKDLRRNQAPEALRQTQARHTHSGMSTEQWAAFLLDYKGPVDNDIDGYVKWADGKIAELKGRRRRRATRTRRTSLMTPISARCHRSCSTRRWHGWKSWSAPTRRRNADTPRFRAASRRRPQRCKL